MTRKKKKKRHPPVFVFTLEMIRIAQEAMKLFEQSFPCVDLPSSKTTFARETMQQVTGKLEAMSLSVGAVCLTTFDYNEKLVLAAAIRLYIFDLLATPSTAQQERKLERSRRIERFALEHLQVEHLRTTQD
ncbi:MAG TPA: hypothetical protein VFV38_20805 [Ktedonobacteraceae bacterium]|nr:hypothetical protein [Ktedonobacteraceae bacterium]